MKTQVDDLNIGEQIIYETHLHWIGALAPAILIIVAAVLWVFAQGSGIATISYGVIAFAAIYGTAEIVKIKSSVVAITNYRVITKIGYFTRQGTEMQLDKIESVGTEQDLIGKMLGYGTVIIRGTGGGINPFKNLTSPTQFRQHLQGQLAVTK